MCARADHAGCRINLYVPGGRNFRETAGDTWMATDGSGIMIYANGMGALLFVEDGGGNELAVFRNSDRPATEVLAEAVAFARTV